MALRKGSVELTDEQEAEAQRVVELVKQCSEEEVLNMARLMASKNDDALFGETEFQVRDILHRLGAKVIEIAANERRKKGIPR
jgi:hypothetical protein